ncbi:hypothetical protein [Phenylobacterium sp.]|uniref:hypothetical protein n=1 Tax=Phenylobacterium sp. TaxID=1871053 RepID=UPI0035ADA202
MTGAQRRGRAVAIGLSVAAHAGLLALVAVHAPRLKGPPPPPAGPPVAIIPLLLSPRAAPDDGGHGGGGPIRLHRRQVRSRDLPPHVAPLVAAERPVPPAPFATPGEAAAAPGPALAAGPAPDLSGALRSRLGCASPQALSRAERAACEERLGRGAAQAAYIPAPIDPAKRAYYEAVAQAKAPDGAPTPQSAPGRGGLFDPDLRGMKGHGPQVGCALQFGPGKKSKGPPNALKLGPCFINPPAGSLSPDVDVPPP